MNRPLRSFLTLSLTTLLAVAVVYLPAARGQIDPVKAKEAAQPKEKTSGQEEEADTVLTMIQDSGWSGLLFMSVLGVFSFLAVTFVIERLVNLTRGKIIPSLFTQQLEQLLSKKEDDPDEYKKLIGQNPSPIANVLNAAMLRIGRPVPEVEKAMEDSLSREVAALRARVRPLTVIGNVAPLVGLLGTVVGMIMAFHTASVEGLGGKAQILAEGIYLALMTTAAGLTIAIPSLLFAEYFKARIDKFMRQIDERLMDTMPFFSRQEQRSAKTAYVTEKEEQLVEA